MSNSILRKFLPGLVVSILTTLGLPPAHAQQQQRPNIVVIWGDDIGLSDVSAYSHGLADCVQKVLTGVGTSFLRAAGALGVSEHGATASA